MPLPTAQTIAVVNKTTICTDDEIRHYVAAIQQFMPEFCAAWKLPDIDVGFVPKGFDIDDGMWLQIIADTPDQAGLLGYHELTKLGYPIGFTFAVIDRAQGSQISTTLSHELWEMLADPFLNFNIEDPDSGWKYMVENADAVESDKYGIVLPMPSGPSVLLSDFVLPSYFDFNAPSGVDYDYRKLLKDPIPAMLPEGYLMFQTQSGEWGQIDAQLAPLARAMKRPAPLGRRYRRMFKTWQLSGAV